MAGAAASAASTSTSPAPHEIERVTAQPESNGVHRHPNTNAGDGEEPDETTALLRVLPGTSEPAVDLFETTAPCFANERVIPTFIRYGFPLLLIATIVLLVMSQSRVAGSAYFNLHYNGTDFRLPVIKTLHFTRTVAEMYFARVYILVGFILAFSGVWPHLKLVMMLYAWMAPVAWFPVRSREFFLQVLDFLGKWSILDIYVSIMLLVGLHLHVPLYDSSEEGVTYIDLWVETDPGVFYYWATIMASLVLTHIMLHTHRIVVNINANITPMATRVIPLCSHHFYSRGR